MKQVERHIIDRQHKFFKLLDDLAFKSKNLYNKANYYMRQNFFEKGGKLNDRLNIKELYALTKPTEAYAELPQKVSAQVIQQVIHDWKAWFQAMKKWFVAPEKLSKKPQIPRYKHKELGRNLLIYDNQSIGQKGKKKGNGIIKLACCTVSFPTDVKKVKEVRVVPATASYIIEVVYEKDIVPARINPKLIAGVDLGLNNLAAVSSNKKGFKAFLINGRPLKSINQQYNKAVALLKSKLFGSKKTSKRIQQITFKRNKKVNDYLHRTSDFIVKRLVAEQIGKLVIGKNEKWKQKINLGKVVNQNFVAIPHARLIEMITYKAQLVGIEVIVTEENYTSKTSFLDLEPVEKHKSYQGIRVKRGLFRSSNGTLINADINGALNIVRKVFGNEVFNSDSIEAFAVAPVRIHPCQLEHIASQFTVL